jgi:xanthosine phosphorylase
MSAAGAVLELRATEPPRVAIVLGSGLGAVADAVTDPVVVDYEELPGFPRPTVAGHAGRAILGRIGAVPVVVLEGRQHLYEGGDLESVRAPIRAVHAAGAEIVLTNAAGSLRREVGGSLMAITDHINLSGTNILIGPNGDELGPRFPSLRDAYDPELRSRLHAAAGASTSRSPTASTSRSAARASRRRPDPRVRGPRRRRGRMSAVHETILARHCGVRVAAISAITNLAEGAPDVALSHEQTLRDGQRAAVDLARLITRFVEVL